MAKRSLASLNAGDLSGKRVLVRVDFNVPLNDAGAITDDTRIRAALPTINDLVGKGAKVVLAAHFGRPKGQVNDAMRLTPVAARLSELLGKTVTKTDSCIGPDAEAKVGAMANGDVVLLENVRFFAEEEKNDAGFAEKLAGLADVYVNDAFGAAHRAHASTEGVTKFLKPSVAGFLMEKELQYLQGAVDEPKRPLAAIVGGSKVSSKIGVLEALIDKCDKVLIGGGMIFTFSKPLLALSFAGDRLGVVEGCNARQALCLPGVPGWRHHRWKCATSSRRGQLSQRRRRNRHHR